MKVKAPDWILRIEDKDTQFFVAFAWYVAQKHGMHSGYYMHTGDIYTLFKGKSHFYIGNSIIAPDAWPELRLAKYNKHYYSFEFDSKYKHIEIDWELPNDKYCAIWIYLMQYDKLKGIVDEDGKGLAQRWKSNQLPEETREWFLDR